jgi:hypothetical protein
MTKAAETYLLHISIDGVEPAIWRIARVDSTLTMDRFHSVLQGLFEWGNCHMFQFEAGDGDETDVYSCDDPRAMKKKLGSLKLKAGDRLRYWYDFGDDWWHTIEVVSADPGQCAPVCLSGENQGPPEDCGGPMGFAELLEAMGKPKSKRYKELVEWMDGPFDPKEFDLERVNYRIGMMMEAAAI